MGFSLVGSTFMPGPLKMCTGFIYSVQWAYVVFISAADLVIILRVYALWNRSKIILAVLLFCYMIQVIIQLVVTAVFDNPHTDATVIISHILDHSICTEVFPVIGPYVKYMVIDSTLFNLLLLILALVPTVKQSATMYKTTKRWQPNRYMSLIVKEGIFYVLLNLLNNIPVAIAEADQNPLNPTWMVILETFIIVTMYPVIPRFMLSIRELYDKDSWGVLTDNGFGVSSRVRQDTVLSEIAFVDNGGNGPSGEAEGEEEIQLGLALWYDGHQREDSS